MDLEKLKMANALVEEIASLKNLTKLYEEILGSPHDSIYGRIVVKKAVADRSLSLHPSILMDALCKSCDLYCKELRDLEKQLAEL